MDTEIFNNNNVTASIRSRKKTDSVKRVDLDPSNSFDEDSPVQSVEAKNDNQNYEVEVIEVAVDPLIGDSRRRTPRKHSKCKGF